MKLGLLNTTIVTSDGQYSVNTISLDEALILVQEADGLDSAIGHAATAEILSRLLGIDVPVNRQEFAQQAGQKALAFKLKGRIPEGQILSMEQIESIGFVFKVLERTV